MSNPNDSKCKCWKCGAAVEFNDRSVRCSNPSCDFQIWKDSLKYFQRGDLTDAELKGLLTPGGSIPLPNLINKAGKKFSCRGEIQTWEKGDGKIRYSIKLIFPDSNSKKEKPAPKPTPLATVETETTGEMEEVF